MRCIDASHSARMTADNKSLGSILIKSGNFTSRLSYTYLRDVAIVPVVAPRVRKDVTVA
jgi:hypothetical protein